MGSQRKEKHVVHLIEVVKKKRQENRCTTKGQKSFGLTKERKHVVHLIKMVKKIMGPQTGQKSKK